MLSALAAFVILLAAGPAHARWRTSGVGDRWVTDGHKAQVSDPGAKGPEIFTLARRGLAISNAWQAQGESIDDQALTFDSALDFENRERQYWANNLIRGKLMMGMYPDTEKHLSVLLDAEVDCFASVQSEVPAQSDAAAWDADSAPQIARYAPAASACASAMGLTEEEPLTFLHCPIDAQRTPSDGLVQNATLLRLLDDLLAHYEAGGRCVYIHSAHGRGRAAVVGGCLLSLLRPELDAKAVLAALQTGYETRGVGGASKSPENVLQSRFVSSFVSATRAANRLQNDMDMVIGGLPKAFL